MQDHENVVEQQLTSNTPEDSRHSKLKSNYDSKSNILSSRAEANVTNGGKEEDTSNNSKIGRSQPSHVSKKSVFVQAQNNPARAFSVSSNVEREQNS